MLRTMRIMLAGMAIATTNVAARAGDWPWPGSLWGAGAETDPQRKARVKAELVEMEKTIKAKEREAKAAESQTMTARRLMLQAKKRRPRIEAAYQAWRAKVAECEEKDRVIAEELKELEGRRGKLERSIGYDRRIPPRASVRPVTDDDN